MPHFRSAVCQVCGVPGTPTEMPLTRASWNCERQPGGGVDERVLPHGRWRGLPAVDGVHRLGTGVVEHEEAATAETGRERLGHAQRGRRRDRGVDGVAAMP